MTILQKVYHDEEFSAGTIWAVKKVKADPVLAILTAGVSLWYTVSKLAEKERIYAWLY